MSSGYRYHKAEDREHGEKRRAGSEIRERAEEADAKRGAKTLKPGTVFRDIDAPWCPEMVVIPPGEFMMGSNEAERDWAIAQGAEPKWVDPERPEHRVRIADPLAVGRYPVTFEEYDHFCDQIGLEKPKDESWGRGRRPVVNVSWDEARAYIKWLTSKTDHSYRLLSEAEWEYCCRAGTATRFCWGDEISPEKANYDRNIGKTSETVAYPANPWGLSDMHGNVWEWVADRWRETYKGAPKDGSAWLRGDQSFRVVRGGSWNSHPRDLRAACRNAHLGTFGNYGIGFRVARALNPDAARLTQAAPAGLRNGESSG